MAIPDSEIESVRRSLQVFVDRVPLDKRHLVEVGFRFERSTVILFESRPSFRDPETRTEFPIARYRYIAKTGLWHLDWMRASGKWERYSPARPTPNFGHLAKIVLEDAHCCFFG